MTLEQKIEYTVKFAEEIMGWHRDGTHSPWLNTEGEEDASEDWYPWDSYPNAIGAALRVAMSKGWKLETRFDPTKDQSSQHKCRWFTCIYSPYYAETTQHEASGPTFCEAICSAMVNLLESKEKSKHG